MVSGAVPDPLAIPPTTGLSGFSAQIRAELRGDEEEWIRVAAQRWAHSRRLVDLAREYASRGDCVAVEVAGRRFDGQIVALGDDRLDLRGPASVVSIRLALGESTGMLAAPLVLWRVASARAGGRRLPAASVSFGARLLELEERCACVRVGSLLFAEEFSGVLTTGRDHIVVSGSHDAVVPSAWVGYVVVDRSGVS